ncbi:energy transducer TonB [Azospirillum sp. sgz302134]
MVWAMGWMIRRWAPFLSVSAHAVVLAGLTTLHEPPRPTPPVLRIELTVPPTEAVAEAAPSPEPPPVPEVSEPPVEPMVEPVEPPPLAEPPADPEPPVPDAPPPAVAPVLAPVPPPPKLQPKPQPKPQPPAKLPPVTHRAPPATMPREAVSAPPSSVAPPPPGATAAPAPVRAAGPPPDYLAAIQARLARHKVYPRAAQLAREQGTVLLRFAVARDGRVLSWSIERGSGFTSLDRQVEVMVERAAPLPPIPDSIVADRLDIVLPVQFALQ